MLDSREVAAAIAEVVEPYIAQIESVMLHGSVVRGDFWPGQSDIDVMIIGRAGDAPLEVEAPLKALAERFPGAYEVELHRCSLATVTMEKGRPFDERWIQFGLHGFDLKGSHLACVGSDQFADLVVVTGDNLRTLAVTRVRSLFGVVRDLCGQDRYRDEMYKWACEVIKAVQIYFATKAGREPTRDKRCVLENFMAHVPNFEEKSIAETIWKHYQDGARRTDREYLDLCDRFVRRAWDTLQTAASQPK